MRFKKVEISAFRIYDKPADSTFDFTLKNGDAAGFISLYAPNGFGKTSFYDAVEWGMTDNIQRFWQNELFKEAMTSQKGASDEQVKVLRNTFSSPKTKTYVKISTDGPEHNRILKIHGNKKWDIADSDSYENRSFRKVILSQEWISAFLKEVDSEKRFSLFMDNPDLNGLNTYYRNLTDLIAANNAQAVALNTEIENEKKKIVEIREANLLETINSSIRRLREKKEHLTPIKLATTDKEALELVNHIASRRIAIADRIRSGREFLDFLAVAVAGNSELSGIDLYFEQLDSKIAADKELLSIESLLNVFAELAKCDAEEKNLVHSREDNFRAIDDLEKIRARFVAYLAIGESIKLKEAAKTDEQKTLTDTQSPLSDLQKKHTDTRTRLNHNFSQLTELQAKIKNYPTLKVALDSLREHLAKCDLDISQIGSEQLKVSDEIQRLQQETKTVRGQLDHVQSCDYGRLMKIFQDAHEAQLIQLSENQLRLQKLNDNLSKVNEQIVRQESFNKELEEFVKKGLELIDRSQASECPLCNQSYESYKALAEKVAANKMLDAAIQELILTKTQTQAEITAVTAKINEENDQITAAINQAIASLNTQLNEKKRVSDNLKNNLKVTEQNRVRNKAEQDRLSTQLGGESLETYLETTEKRLTELQALQDGLTSALKSLEAQMDPLIEAGQIATVKIDLLSGDVVALRANADYVAILDWFKANEAGSTPTEQVLLNRIKALETKNRAATARIADLVSTRNELQKKSAQTNHQQLSERKNELTLNRENLVKAIASYQNYVARFTNIDAGQMKRSALADALEELRGKNQEEITRQQALDTDYQNLSEYCTNLLPFLQSENARIRIEGFHAELAEMQHRLLPLLETEKNAVRIHLEEKIKSFFYTGLINQIYNKIDPHPEFKAVEFRANFDVGTPTLDVFVTNENREQTLIPNLYFSSAQINILSLSIFLASALNSSEYDCIFIDDPIQSMDSINVLSTIDLLRSIVVNENKQIILSTHDSNFHNLLKKKIPSGIFSSKFLELESFGKVKES